MPVRLEFQKPVPKVFSLATPKHMLAKLYWEVSQLRKAIVQEGRKFTLYQVQAYCVFNCAVTAWHLTDWVWESADQEMRDEMCRELGATNSHKKDFQSAIARNYRALHICRQIANGSKHMRLDREDPAIEAGVVWEEKKARAGSARTGEKMSEFHRKLVVSDNKTQKPVIDLFDDACNSWKHFLGRWGFIEESIVPP